MFSQHFPLRLTLHRVPGWHYTLCHLDLDPPTELEMAECRSLTKHVACISVEYETAVDASHVMSSVNIYGSIIVLLLYDSMYIYIIKWKSWIDKATNKE